MRRDGTTGRLAAALRALAGPGARARAARAWGEVRRRPDAVLAVLLGAGVLVMVIHWG